MSFADAAKGPAGRTPSVAVPAVPGKSVVARFASTSTAAANSSAAAGPSGGSGGGAGGSSAGKGSGDEKGDKDATPNSDAAALVVPQRPLKSHLNEVPTREMPNPERISLRDDQDNQTVYDARTGKYLHLAGSYGPERPALRANFAYGNNSTEIYVNHFQVTLPPGTILYEYLISSTSEEWLKATRNKRKVFIRDFIDISELSGKAAQIASDYRTKIITGYDVLGGSGQRPARDELSVRVPCYMRGTRDNPTVVTLTMKLNRKFKMDDFQHYVQGRNIDYEETGAAEAMNIMVSKAVADGSEITFQAGQNKFYYRPGWKDFGGPKQPDDSGLLAMRGYYCSIRPAMGTVTLNINTLTSTFYHPQTVQWYLEVLDPRGKRFPRANDNSEARKRNLREVNQHLAGLRGYVNFDRSPPDGSDPSIDSDRRRTKTINNLASYADELKFIPKPEGAAAKGASKDHPHEEVMESANHDSGRGLISVWDHIQNKYPRQSLGVANQIAVNVGGKPPNTKYYLASQIQVLGDQIYRRKLPAHLLPKMIDIARRPPAENRTAILGEGLTSLGFRKSKQPDMFKVLDVKVSRDMMSVPARRIKVPTVCYGDDSDTNSFQPLKGSWTTRNKLFLDNTNKFNPGSNPAMVQFLCVGPPGTQPSSDLDIYGINFMNFRRLAASANNEPAASSSGRGLRTPRCHYLLPESEEQRFPPSCIDTSAKRRNQCWTPCHLQDRLRSARGNHVSCSL